MVKIKTPSPAFIPLPQTEDRMWPYTCKTILKGNEVMTI